MASGSVRPPSVSTKSARERELRRPGRLSALERMLKALALGRRCRQLRDMAQSDLPQSDLPNSDLHGDVPKAEA